MRRSELREHLFKVLFQLEFGTPDEMPESIKLYIDGLENAEFWRAQENWKNVLRMKNS